jgi:Lar family restriction alleviation protein
MVTGKTPVNEPCPFCGDRYAKIDTLNYTSGKPGRFRVQCRNCGGATKWHNTGEDAWKAWNSRYVKLSPELEAFIFNPDAFVYKGRLYIRERPSLYCFAQKEFRGALKRIKKSDFISTCQEAALARAEQVNTECKKTVVKVKEIQK